MTVQESNEIIDKMDIWEKFAVWNHYQIIQTSLRCHTYFYWGKGFREPQPYKAFESNILPIEPLTFYSYPNDLSVQTIPFEEFIKFKIYDWYWRFN